MNKINTKRNNFFIVFIAVYFLGYSSEIIPIILEWLSRNKVNNLLIVFIKTVIKFLLIFFYD
ncbi:hypothetical protein BTO04_06895 [Polaribacter sp. SA4-10]|nr:hypothetical protein BTO04_06895 [Polaribacter sp. SA4-10]